MRFMMKVSLPVETANNAAKDGSLARTIRSIVSELKPEAAYFTDDDGRRTGFLFFDMRNSSDIPAVAEPWFLAFNARVEIHPAMNAEDLEKAEVHIRNAVQKYGR